MDSREHIARQNGRIKLFLDPEEIALLLSALTAVRSEMALAKDQLPNIKYDEVKERVPPDLFSNMDSVMDTMARNLMAQCETDFEERENNEGAQQFHEMVHDRWERYRDFMELMQLVLLAAYSQDAQGQGEE